MPNLYPFIDDHAGWGFLAVVLLALALRGVQRRREPRAPPALAAAPGGGAAWALVCAAALAAFAGLARQVMADAPPAWLVALDGWAGGYRQAIPAWAMEGVAALTHLGDVATLTVLAALVALALAWRRRWLAAGWWLLAVIGNGLLVRWTKQVFGRARPDAPYLEVHGYSFPSGHAMSALAVYGLLCVMLWRWQPAPPQGAAVPAEAGRAQPAARRLAVALALLAAAVGGSRVWLGVHYASDVIAGWLLALAWLAGVGLLARPAARP